MTTSLIDLSTLNLRINGLLSRFRVGFMKTNPSILAMKPFISMWSDKKSGANLFKNLRRIGKIYQLHSKDKQAGRGFIKNV
ncbi:MAG: hypothetical protein ACJAZP_004142 [Psychromonas sp.]|jgi:hypothetical protein